MILSCTCAHPFQDKTYGRGKRVHTFAPGNAGKQNRWRCTVCGTLRELSRATGTTVQGKEKKP